jgi:hypothetical protein
MKNYLIILEDLSTWFQTEITGEDFNCADGGVITIIRMSDGMEYLNGEWVDIEIRSNK